MIVDWTYNSNAIEGNTLTIFETKAVLEHGLTIAGKSLKEHLEVLNHKEAIVFYRIYQSKRTNYLKMILKIFIKNIDNDSAGRYRLENVIISGDKHIPSTYLVVQEKISKLISDYQNKWSNLHPIIIASLLHGEFIKIHPFIDGNGRTARLILNFVLIRYGYPAIIIKKENRVEYYESLDKAHTTKDYSNFINLIEKLVLEERNYISLLWNDLFECFIMGLFTMLGLETLRLFCYRRDQNYTLY